MRYSQVVRTALAAAAAQERLTFPTGVLLAARAAEAIAPDQMAVSSARFKCAGRFVDGPADVRDLLAVPGVRVMSPLMVDVSGVVSTISPPAGGILGDGDYHSARTDLGELNVAFIGELVDLWQDRIRGLGLIPTDQVDRCVLAIKAGYIVFPVSPSALVGLGYPSALQVPALSADDLARWSKMTDALQPAVKAYLAKNLSAAADAVAAANRDAELWAALQVAVEAVRDAVPNAIGGALSALGTKNLIIIGGVVLVIGVFFLAPKLAAAKSLVRA